MKAHLTESLIQNLRFTGKQYDVYDITQKGLILRVNAKEGKTYTVQYKRGGRIKIASFGDIALKIARLKTMQIIGEAKNCAVLDKKTKTKTDITYTQFLNNYYYPQYKEQYRGAYENYQMLTAFFVPLFGDTKLADIDAQKLKKWITGRLKFGVKKSTINRNLASFKASLNWAVESELITQNPVACIKLFKNADEERSRYLTENERHRFFENLTKFPLLFQVVVKIAIFSGLRRKEALTLEWRDVYLEDRDPYLTVRAENAKNGVSRSVPINKTLYEALLLWKKKTANSNSAFLFVNPETGKRFYDFRKKWDRLCRLSEINDFRWHDMRHEFATSLLKNGVGLYTIQKLLGHLDSDMTKRYTHIADKMLADAVAKLD